jgi:hypothetical protein
MTPLNLLAAAAIAITLAASPTARADDCYGSWGSNACREKVDGSGKRATDTRQLSGFSELNIGGSWQVVLKQGKTESVVIEADDNLLPFIETEIKGKGLHIQPKRGTRLNFSTRPTVTVNFVDLHSVSLGGSNNVTSDGVKGDKLTFNLGGGGNVKFDNLQMQRLTVNIGGSGSFTAAGKAETQSFNIGGSGSIRADELEGQKVSASIGGSGNLRLHAKDTLSVSIAGSGSVAYKGDPKVSRSVVGSGSIRKLDN